MFYSHVNYSVTKIYTYTDDAGKKFYSHVNYSVTKIGVKCNHLFTCFTVT